MLFAHINITIIVIIIYIYITSSMIALLIQVAIPMMITSTTQFILQIINRHGQTIIFIKPTFSTATDVNGWSTGTAKFICLLIAPCIIVTSTIIIINNIVVIIIM